MTRMITTTKILVLPFDEDEEQPVDLAADFEDELRRHMPQWSDHNPPPVPPSGTQAKLDDYDNPAKLITWPSAGALTLFRKNADNIADTYLKTQNTKLGKGRERNRSIKDVQAYEEGLEDSKKIDVKRRRIEDKENLGADEYEATISEEKDSD